MGEVPWKLQYGPYNAYSVHVQCTCRCDKSVCITWRVCRNTLNAITLIQCSMERNMYVKPPPYPKNVSPPPTPHPHTFVNSCLLSCCVESVALFTWSNRLAFWANLAFKSASVRVRLAMVTAVLSKTTPTLLRVAFVCKGCAYVCVCKGDLLSISFQCTHRFPLPHQG